MKRILLAAIAMSLILTTTRTMASPPPADLVMAQAQAKAAKEHKAIFLHFGASWCGWCKRLDAYLDRPEVKPVLEKYFVLVTLDIQEHGEKKALENAGGDAYAEKFGGLNGGLPYIALLDAEGALLVNSRPTAEAQNIGFPSAPAEVEWFLKMLKKAAPAMTDADLKTFETPLRVVAKPVGDGAARQPAVKAIAVEK